MPSLCSVSERDPSQSAKAKECGDDITVVDADADIDVTAEGESQTDNKDSLPSNSALNKQSDSSGTSIDDPIEVSTESEAQGHTTSESSTPNSKKRQITPNDDSGSKQKQQKKVNQMTLSSFFFKGSKTPTTASTPSKTPQRKATKSPKNRTPPPSEAKKGETSRAEKSEVIDVDMVPDEGQSTTTPSEESKPSPTEIAVKMETSEETKLNDGSAVCSVDVIASAPGTKPTTESLATNAINVLSESVVKKKPRARAAKSKKNSPSAKESSARKPKKTKALDSLVTNVVKKELSESELSEENRSLLQKYRTMKERYLERVHDVNNKHKAGLPEEDLGDINLQPITDDTELKTNDTGNCEEFPSQVVSNMALIIEGR